MFYVKQATSKLNIRHLSKNFSKRDPGIRQRKKILNTNQELEETDLDDLEADFMNVHKTHRQYEEEMNVILEKEKFHIVKQRYFKEKYPNFLTWSDKEQIKYLHSTNPEEWTVERLSESFPALPDVIKKILKSKWTKDSTKIHNHDVAVQKNWKMFKNGEIPHLPNELVELLNKFTNRSVELRPFQTTDNKKVIEIRNKNVGTEFSEIITSYEKLKNKNKTDETGRDLHLKLNAKAEGDSYLAMDRKKMNDKRHVTLQQLKNTIENKANSDENLSEEDKLIVKSLQIASENQNLVELNQNDLMADIANNKYETNKGGVLITKTTRDFSHLTYPEIITIPKDKVKKGYTYKLNDCYYDYDGRFLYRVPGMS